ncbi:hypothetical protein ACFW04_012821 [Cataglyphis niger]
MKTFPQCIEESRNNREPLIPSEFSQRSWQKIGIDLFKLKQKWDLLATDYYFRYPKVALLTNLREDEVIKHLKSIFSRHGTPEKEWAFKHTMSSPKFPQSNGFVESMVKIIKRGLKKNEDGYKALQSYQSATTLSNGLSPTELLMGRRIRTISIATKKLDPKVSDKQTVLRKEKDNRLKLKFNYDSRHRAKNLSELKLGDQQEKNSINFPEDDEMSNNENKDKSNKSQDPQQEQGLQQEEIQREPRQGDYITQNGRRIILQKRLIKDY